MSGTLSVDAPADAPAVALAGAHSLVDDLFAADLTLGTDDELLASLRDLERLTRRLVAVGHGLIAEAQDRCLPHSLGAASMAVLLGGLLRLHPGEARARVRAAEVAGPRRAQGRAAPAQPPHNPDGFLDDPKDRERKRDLTLRPRPDGSAAVRGELTAECAERLQCAFDALGAPVPEAGRGQGPAHRGAAAPRRAAGRVDPVVSGRVPTRSGRDRDHRHRHRRRGIVQDWERAGRDRARRRRPRQGRVAVGRRGPAHQRRPRHRRRTRSRQGHRPQRHPASVPENQRLAILARDGGCTFPGVPATGPEPGPKSTTSSRSRTAARRPSTTAR
jgi:Domain of unknown function (DUF222)